jgi:hypothetical protein
MTAELTTATAAPNTLTRQVVFNVLGALGAILTLLTAVMFYFGWRRSDAQARAMRIDVSLFGFTSQDYVLRSISSLYLPLLVILGLGLLWTWCHIELTKLLGSDWLDQNSRRAALATVARVVLLASVVLAAGCVLFSAFAGRESAPWPVEPIADALAPREWIVPLVLTGSTLLALYAAWLRRQLIVDRQETAMLWTRMVPPALAAATVALGGFWLLEEYAASVGQDYAEDVVERVDRLPRAVVTSPIPLGVQAPGVVEQPITGPAGTARYRTTGLRFLARSGGKVLLVHDGWTPADGVLIVLADTDDLAWEFSR